jgi:hypothetical protein
LWHETSPFVLAFRKPRAPGESAGDPDLPRPLDAAALVRALPPVQPADSAVVFVGLDRGRAVAHVLREHLPSSTRLFDVVLDEWALSREEMPPGMPLPGVEVLRSDKGSLPVPTDVHVGLVLFVDAYHRLWNPAPLLKRLREQLMPSSLVAVVDRDGPEAEQRRLAGHRRRLASRLVIEDLRQAGFRLRQTLPAPTEDRYFMLFEPASAPTDSKPENFHTAPSKKP